MVLVLLCTISFNQDGASGSVALLSTSFSGGVKSFILRRDPKYFRSPLVYLSLCLQVGGVFSVTWLAKHPHDAGMLSFEKDGGPVPIGMWWCDLWLILCLGQHVCPFNAIDAMLSRSLCPSLASLLCRLLAEILTMREHRKATVLDLFCWLENPRNRIRIHHLQFNAHKTFSFGFTSNQRDVFVWGSDISGAESLPFALRKVPQISYGSTSPALSNKDFWPEGVKAWIKCLIPEGLDFALLKIQICFLCFFLALDGSFLFGLSHVDPRLRTPIPTFCALCHQTVSKAKPFGIGLWPLRWEKHICWFVQLCSFGLTEMDHPEMCQVPMAVCLYAVEPYGAASGFCAFRTFSFLHFF